MLHAGAFELYDIDKDGKITKEEMTNIVQAIFDMVGDKNQRMSPNESPEQRVEMIFELMDEVRIVLKSVLGPETLASSVK